MPDRDLPFQWQLTLRVTRFVIYTLTACLGVSGIFFTPTTLVDTIGSPSTIFWAALVLAGGITGMIGVAWNRYRIEWMASWPLAGGTLGYAAIVWLIVLQGNPSRSAQAFALTAFGLALASRGITLAAHAAKMRRLHRLVKTSPAPLREKEEKGD